MVSEEGKGRERMMFNPRRKQRATFLRVAPEKKTTGKLPEKEQIPGNIFVIPGRKR